MRERAWWDHTDKCLRTAWLVEAAAVRGEFPFLAKGCTCQGATPPRDTFDDMPEDREAYYNERAERMQEDTWR